MGPLHHHGHRQPRRGHPGHVPGAAAQRAHRQAGVRAVLRPGGEAVPARPLHRGHLPALRLRRGPRRPVRALRDHPRRHRPDRAPVQDQRRHARTPAHGALLLPLLGLHREGGRLAEDPQGLAPPRSELRARLDGGGPARPGHHPRPGLGRGAARGRPRRGQAHLRLVRRRDRLPLGVQGVVGPQRRPRCLEAVVAQRLGPPRVFHGQGQRPLPLPVLAGPAHGIRRGSTCPTSFPPTSTSPSRAPRWRPAGARDSQSRQG